MGYRIIIFSILFLLANVVQCDTDDKTFPTKLSISQLNVYFKEIWLYASLVDGNGNSIDNIAEKQVEVSLDGQLLKTKEVKKFNDTNQGIAYTFLLDVSATMKGEPFRQAVEAISNLLRKMSKNDKVAVITFGNDVQVLTDFTDNYESIATKLSALVEATAQTTHFYAAIKRAIDLNKRQDNQLPVRRAIFVATDGKDEGSGITIEDLTGIMENELIPPIYSIGYSKIDKSYLDNLKRLSNLSNGTFTEEQEFERIYQDTITNIKEQLFIKVEVLNIQVDNFSHTIQLVVSFGQAKISDSQNVNLNTPNLAPAPNLDSSPDTAPSSNDNFPWYVIFVLFGLLGSGVYWKIKIHRRKNKNNREDVRHFEPTILSQESILPQNNIVENNSYLYTHENNNSTSVIPEPKMHHSTMKQVKFIILNTQEVDKRHAIGKNLIFSIGDRGISIGNGNNADITLCDDKIATLHCLVTLYKGRLVVKNIEDEHKTFVNGLPIPGKEMLEDDDVIMLGDSKIRIKILDTN